MKWLSISCLSLTIFSLVLCDFYAGMFQKNDLLVAQDRLYKERIPYRLQNAKYGRVFKCPITYLRVVDRLGSGRGPKTTIIRGGLRRKYVVLRLSAYNRPISVNIYVGCDNKLKYTTRRKTTTAKVNEKTIKTNSTVVDTSSSTEMAKNKTDIAEDNNSDVNASNDNTTGDKDKDKKKEEEEKKKKEEEEKKKKEEEEKKKKEEEEQKKKQGAQIN